MGESVIKFIARFISGVIGLWFSLKRNLCGKKPNCISKKPGDSLGERLEASSPGVFFESARSSAIEQYYMQILEEKKNEI